MPLSTYTCDLDAMRADVFLSQTSGITRSRAASIIAEGAVAVNGSAIKKAGHRLSKDDVIVVSLPETRPSEILPENIPLSILYEDEHLLVVDKPVGMVVHPSAGHDEGTLVHALLHHCSDLSGVGGVERPGIVHRLDKDTSGALVIAKGDAAHAALAGAFARHAVVRIYAAMVEGGFKEEGGVIDAPIGRHPRHRQRMSVVPGGRSAVTMWRVLLAEPKRTLIACRLITGRTHQIRVHFASIGHAVIGDPVYGHGRPGDFQRLHGWKLGFEHPITHDWLSCEAPLPDWVPPRASWQQDEEELEHGE